MTQTAREQLAEQVRRVAEARRALTENQQELAERRKAFDEMNRVLIGATLGHAAEVDAAEGALEALALAHFQQTGEKRPTAGVEVKEKSTLDYDREKAEVWSKQHGMCRIPESLDVKAFEKIAKVTPFDFVTTIITPQAQIARDLSAALSAGATVQEAA